MTVRRKRLHCASAMERTELCAQEQNDDAKPYRCFRRSGSVSSVSSSLSNGQEPPAASPPAARVARQRRVGFCVKAPLDAPLHAERDELVCSTIQSNMFELERLAVHEAKIRRASDTVVARAAAAAASHSRMLIMNEMTGFGSLTRTPQGSADGLAHPQSSSNTIVNSSLASSIGSGITVVQESAPGPTPTPHPYVAMAAACAAALNAPQLLSQLGSAFTPYLTLAASFAAQQSAAQADCASASVSTESEHATHQQHQNGSVSRSSASAEDGRANDQRVEVPNLPNLTDCDRDGESNVPTSPVKAVLSCGGSSAFSRVEQRQTRHDSGSESAENGHARLPVNGNGSSNGNHNGERVSASNSGELLRRLMSSEPDTRYFTQRVTSILLSELMMSNSPSLYVASSGENASLEADGNRDSECEREHGGREGRESNGSRSSISLEREHAHRTLMEVCSILERLLYDLIEWARQAYLFRSVPLDDQILLLQSCWMDLLILTVVQFKLRCGDLIQALVSLSQSHFGFYWGLPDSNVAKHSSTFARSGQLLFPF